MPILAWIIAVTLAGGILSVIAAATLALRAGPAQLPILISYAIGALLGAVFLEILPHAFEQAGIGLSLGLVETVSDEIIAGNVRKLLNDPSRRRQMRAAGLTTVDGEGPARVAADLVRALAERRTPVKAAL